MAFLATWSFTSRCGLILLIAIALRPAPTPVLPPEFTSVLQTLFVQETQVEEHHMERESRQNFDVLLALHLCDFSWDAWLDMAHCQLTKDALSILRTLGTWNSAAVLFDWTTSLLCGVRAVEETYQGAPAPAIVVVSNCGHAALNGEYMQDMVAACAKSSCEMNRARMVATRTLCQSTSGSSRRIPNSRSHDESE